jgi:mutual gliding-motility protein MglA
MCWVMQYNKRDLPSIATVEELRASLNRHGVPEHEACARTGVGVYETLKTVSKLLLKQVQGK